MPINNKNKKVQLKAKLFEAILDKKNLSHLNVAKIVNNRKLYFQETLK